MGERGRGGDEGSVVDVGGRIRHASPIMPDDALAAFGRKLEALARLDPSAAALLARFGPPEPESPSGDPSPEAGGRGR